MDFLKPFLEDFSSEINPTIVEYLSSSFTHVILPSLPFFEVSKHDVDTNNNPQYIFTSKLIEFIKYYHQNFHIKAKFRFGKKNYLLKKILFLKN